MPAIQNLLHQRCFDHATRGRWRVARNAASSSAANASPSMTTAWFCSACLKKLARVPLAKQPTLSKFSVAQCLARNHGGVVFFFDPATPC